jgi:hypothetical protein
MGVRRGPGSQINSKYLKISQNISKLEAVLVGGLAWPVGVAAGGIGWMGWMGRMGRMVFGSGHSVGVAAGAGDGGGGEQNAKCRMQNAKGKRLNAERTGPAGGVPRLAFSVASNDFSKIMGLLKHTSEKATPYRTDEMQVKKGVFDREKTLVKTR